MSDLPPTVPGQSIPSKIADAAQSVVKAIGDGLAFLLSYLPVSWKKYVALVALLIGTIWLTHDYLGWRVPQWTTTCPTVAQIVAPVAKGPTLLEFNQLDTRVEQLESRTIHSQPVAVPPAAPPKPKKKGKANAGNSSDNLLPFGQ